MPLIPIFPWLPLTAPKPLIEFPTSPTLPIKLTIDNHPTWFKQVHQLFVVNDTIGYVTGTTPCPPTTIGTGDFVTDNPDHSHWVRQDHYVCLALLGFCGPEAQVVMSSAIFSVDAWTRLMKAYANRSRTRIMSLKERLSSIAKGSSSISEYLQSILFLANELALIGHLVDDLDLVIATLNGLGPLFREFNTFDELFDKFVDFNTFIQCDDRHHQVAPLTANHVNRFSSSVNRGKRYPRDFFPPTKIAPPPFCRLSFPPYSRRSSSHMVPTCQYCDHFGHTTKICYRLHGYLTRPKAHFVTTVTPNESAWLVDSGPSHHVTNDLGSLSISKNMQAMIN
ncbi:hypothetical protein V8G54_026848 [Vigna mungo]|uniref:Retrotransposon Copia-like N-terminal domain-containing protein n=1 Tax=Vigna mungo TaxID=3915 RepID=A0AAQ3N0T1_VIGMU